MKKKVTRIFDKQKTSSRKKYLLGIIAILILQVAICLGTFSKAESVIGIKYINYYTLEEYETNIEVQTDLTGQYITLPESVNNREAIVYYIANGEESVKYNPNDTYYIESEEQLLVKIEYGEVIVVAENQDNKTEESEQVNTGDVDIYNEETNTEQEITNPTDIEDNQTQTEQQPEVTPEPEIIDVIYLGECGQEGEEGTELNPFRNIEMAFEALPENGGTIIIKGHVTLDKWASSSAALNKDVIVKGYNNESYIVMEGNWQLQGNTNITDVKLVMSETKQNLAIYSNGYNLVLGTEGNRESLKISAKGSGYYPTIYGGSSSLQITKNINVTIHSGMYQNIYGGSNSLKINGNIDLNINYAVCFGDIYGGSNSAELTGNVDLDIEYVNVKGNIYGGSNKGTLIGSTDLYIKDAEVGRSVYGGMYIGTQSKGTSTTVIENGIYGTLITNENEIAISGGSNVGSRGAISLTIKNATVVNGCVTGAGGSSTVSGKTDFVIEKITLGENGEGTNSIYGLGYTANTTVQNDINMTIQEITGKPKYIAGYCNLDSANNMTGNITLNLSNINSGNTEIYGGSINGAQTTGVPVKITTTNVNAKILSAGGLKASGVKSYNITVNSGSFSNGIYAGIGTNSVSNVASDSNYITLNGYSGKLYLNNKTANVTLNNSNVTTGERFYFAYLNLNSSKLEIASLLYSTWSLGTTNIDANSELTIRQTKKIIFYGDLTGKGTLRLEDGTTASLINNGIIGPLKIDIIEDEDLTNSFVNILSAQKETQNELYLNEELEGYTTEFADAISYWKFYKGNNPIESVADCVYLNTDFGNDSNSGEITAPVKTIEKASQIIKNNPTKKKVVLLSHLDFNLETPKATDTSEIYTILSTTDGKIDLYKYISLAAQNSVTNIYQNIEIENVRLIASGTQNIYLNGNKLRINSGVGTSGTINLYGGSNSTNLEGINGNIEIKGGTWNNIYGGGNTGTITGNTNITIAGGTINENVYGGSNVGDITGDTNIIIKGGNIKKGVYGGSNTGNITGNTNVTVSTGTIGNNLFGGSANANIIGNTNANITGGRVSWSAFGGSSNGDVRGSTNLIISAGSVADRAIGGNSSGNITGTTNLKITGGTVGGNIYGGSVSGSIVQDTTAGIVGGTNLEIANINKGGTIYGGNGSGSIIGDISIKFSNVSFNDGTTIYRGSDSASLIGNIKSTFENINFATTNTNLYYGSKSGNITGDVSVSIQSGQFKNNLCNAKVFAGNNTGLITGDITFEASGVTFANEVYGGSDLANTNGNITFIANGATFNSNLYTLGHINSTAAQTEPAINSVTLQNSTIKGVLFVAKSTGTNVVSDINANIQNVTLKEIAAFNSYNTIKEKVTINISQAVSLAANGKITISPVRTNANLDLAGVLTYNLSNNTPEFNFTKDTKIEHLNISNSSVIVSGALKTNDLTVVSNGSLDLEKASTVANNFIGDSQNKYGEIYVYDGLQIGVASGKTLLRIGTITGDISSPALAFVKETGLNTDVSTTDTVEGTRTWTVGYLNYLDVVYVDGVNGNDDTNIGDTANTAVQTLKTAYLYCKEGGTIVVSGSITLTAWPSHTQKEVTITSKFNGVDYRTTNNAKVTLNTADTLSSVNLEADTVFEYLTFVVTNTQNIFANGYKLTLGVEGDTNSIKVVDAAGNLTTAYLNIYGGTFNRSVASTNLQIHSGSYRAIYGGGTNGNYTTGNTNTVGTVVQNIKITGGTYGVSWGSNTIIAGNYSTTIGYVYGGINIDISNAKITGNILSSGYSATTHGDVTLNIGKNVTHNGTIFTDQNSGNIDSKYKHTLNIDGTGGTTSTNAIYFGSIYKYNSSSRYEANITNSTVNNIYYGSYYSTGTADTVKGNVYLDINNGAKISNIYAARYTNDTTLAGNFYITVNTNDNLTTNIYKSSPNGGGVASECIVTFDGKTSTYTGNIQNITKLDIRNNSDLNINGTTFGVANLVVDGSTLNIGEKVTSMTLGNVSVNDTATLKILNALTQIKLSGNLIGGGNIYLNDNIRVEIAGNVTNSTTVYCNQADNYFEKGTIIVAKIAATTLENAFETAENKAWKYIDNENTRIWQIKDFNINSIIYVNSSTGTDYGLGTLDMPVKNLDAAYKIANMRYEADKVETKYYIVLQNNLNVTQDSSSAIKLNDNIEVVITNKIEDEGIEYPSAVLNVSTPKYNFVGKTTIENITINTTGYAGSVEFFANGNNVIFGKGLVVNAALEKYPIIYGGTDTKNISVDSVNLTVLSGKYNMIFGGGKTGTVNGNINLTLGSVSSDTLDVTGYGRDSDSFTGVFGAGREGSVTGNIKMNINSGKFYRIYGAGLTGTTTGNIEINYKGGETTRLYGGGQRGTVEGNTEDGIGNVNINIGGGDIASVTSFLRGSGQYQGVAGTTNLNIYNGASLDKTTQVAAGGYQGNVGNSNLNIYGGTILCDVYGGGWGIVGDPSKGKAGNTQVYVHYNANVQGDVYGGGYAGTANKTDVIIESATVNNVYGGGNEAKIEQDTSVKLISASIKDSAYGGGKGVTATVKGNSQVIVSGDTNIAGNLFGGGNAAMTGLQDATSTSRVYIVGGTIEKDVYGGANTAIVYGDTYVKIGKQAVGIQDLVSSNILIKGTVFGGGRSNAAGSEDYDFTFESVTGDVYMIVDEQDTSIDISKSIFASGNAAKISGNGYVTIQNFGTETSPKDLVSIQRATEVTIDNSSIWIGGTTDRTNELSTAVYTINRVQKLNLKNNSVLYLSNGVNLVENLYSLDESDKLEYVNLAGEQVIQNTNNKIFLRHGKNMVLTTEDGGNGSVHGMMFIGKFDGEQSVGRIETGIYSDEYTLGATVKDDDMNILGKNSYVQAQHAASHDTKKDGFYTNTKTEQNIITVEYIVPTPEEGTYYQWLIGELSESIYYEDIELIASKYSTTAQATIDLVGLNAPDMVLEVEGITTYLKEGISLKQEDEVPNIAEDANIANSVFGLTMSNGHQGWRANGTTSYLYDNNTTNIVGNKTYYADKSTTTPTLTFNFVHAKNVVTDPDLGRVSIRLRATYLEGEELVQRIVFVEIKLSAKETTSTIDYYEGAITPGLKYTAFPTATTNITSKSAVSTYYSIYLENYDNVKYNSNYKGYYHAITSSFVLPQGTKIVMVDKSKNEDKYYYYIVTDSDEKAQKTSYKFTDFLVMGTLDEHYNSDSIYYNSDKNYVLEEFVFQVDFGNATITQNYLRQTLKIELINQTDNTTKLTVNDAMYPMMYNLYYDQETEKTMTIDVSTVHLYEAEDLDFVINTNYDYKIVNSNVVYDTQNFDNAAGIRVTFYNGTKQLTKEELGGLSIAAGGSEYFVREDGSIRFKISDVVSNVETKMKVNLMQKENWTPGTYTMRVEAISSTDGVSASNSIMSENVTIIFSSSDYGLDVILDENSQVIAKETGTTLNGNNILDFSVKYKEGLETPSIRVAIYRRDYSSIYTPIYNLVDLKDYVENNLVATNKENEYLVTSSPIETQKLTLNLKQNLITGTYKIKFLVYDGENYIGEVYKMIIIK